MNTPDDDSPSPQAEYEAIDWQFSFDRAEMLRQFKANFFTTLNHDLRSPINTQISSLDIVLADLYESQTELRGFVADAQQAARDHLTLIEACLMVGRYCPSIQSSEPRSQPLLPILQRVHQLTNLQARTRLIAYAPVSAEILTPTVRVRADENGLEQALLALLSWAIAHLTEGRLELSVEVEPEAIVLQWRMSGVVSELPSDTERAGQLTWRVAERLLTDMNARVSLSDESSAPTIDIRCVLPRYETE